MANPNIDLLGAVYPTVAGVTLPKQGGGTATFPYVEGSQTITQNGTVDVTNLAEVVVNVSGGGASNVVTGTFKGTTTGAAMDVTLNYSGSGYPVAVMIYPSEGGYNLNDTSSIFYNTIERYAIRMFLMIKNKTSSAPNYNSTAVLDYGNYLVNYKNSTSNANSYTQTSGNNYSFYNDVSATSGSGTVIKIRSKTKMSVFIASNSYGFMANVDYQYVVLYSS